MDFQKLEEGLAELPLYIYGSFDPQELEFSHRVRWICQHECPMYGTTWACPPGVGSVEECRMKCQSFRHGLMISTIVETADISDLEETLATRRNHEDVTNQVRALFREQGVEPYVLSTEACALCSRCAYLDGQPCRHPDQMHPCVESQGINIVPILEQRGLEFQFGSNVVTWVSLLLY